MKEIKVKNVTSTDNIGSGSYSQKHLQATEEQIRYAKLSQMNSKEESKIQEKMKEVSEVTRKPPDVVSIALHDCSYDTNMAIHNILEGYYDENPEGDWKTKSTKNRKKTAASPVETSPTHVESTEATIDKLCNDFGTPDIDDQKPTHTPNRLSRGGGTGRGRSTNSDSWDKSPPEERFGDPPEKSFPKERGRSNDRGGRGRGRGRGIRGGLNRGVRGGRGGFGRGSGSFRGSGRQNRGFSRGNNSSRDRGDRGDRGYRKQDNDVVNTPVEESWDMDSPEKLSSNDHQVPDWADETPTTNDNIQTDWGKEDSNSNWGNKDDEWNKEDTDWRKDNWGDQPAEQSKGIFSRDVDWSQLNNQQDTDGWAHTPPKDDRLKYLPENIDTAVIRSIPNSSTTGEVTSYQPTDDISRYINSPSNQFPSSHQEGGLTNSLKDRAFSLPSNANVSDVIRTISSMPIVSGVTESHKLEQEQLRTSKSHHQNKSRRGHRHNLPSQPVVMPRSARMVNDVEEQFTGLEFGSGPLSPRISFTEKQPPLSDMIASNNHDVSQNVLTENIQRHPVALPNEKLISHASKVLPQSSNISVISASKIETSNPQSQIMSKADVLKTPPGFKPLDQNASHYLSSPGRGHPHLTPEPIPFPSSTNRTSPTSTINVFSRNGGLGTSVVISEQQSPISNYSDKKIYDQHENNINAEKIIAEQKALAEKQFRAEQQLVLSEKNERTRPVIDQRSFSEEKPQAQNKLLNNKLKPNEQQVTSEELSRNDRLTNDLPEQRKSISDTRVAMNDAHRQNKDGIKLTKGDGNVSGKVHGQSPTTNQLNTNVITKSTYISGAVISSEMLSLNSNSGAQTTKSQMACNKTTSAPPGVLTPMNLYAGVQPGIMPTYQQQALHGYSYDELLQMQRVPMPPYTYDVSMFPSAAATGPTSAREGIQTYQGNESKFNRGADDSTTVNLPQGTAHVAAGNIPTQAAYMNATGQLPYGYTYAYQPSVLPQGGVYPAFTTQSVYQMTQGKGTQYQTQYQPSAQQQTAYNSSKYSGSAGHEFSKANYHNNPAGQVALAAHPKVTQQNSSSSPSPTIQSGPRSAYKSQYNQDAKGYLANCPTSMTTQHGIHMHNQAVAAAAHIGNVNHYLVQPHTNLMTHSGQISASHLNHPQIDASSHRSQVHQIPFSGNQQKRDTKGSYGSYWLGNR